MTYREALRIKDPDFVDDMYTGGCRGCPSDYFGNNSRCLGGGNGCCNEENCRKCWDREMPEEKKAEEPIELNINLEEEKEMPRLSSIIRNAVLNAIEDSAIEEAVEEAFENYDYREMIQTAVNDYLDCNIEDIASEAVQDAVRSYMEENL